MLGPCPHRRSLQEEPESELGTKKPGRVRLCREWAPAGPEPWLPSRGVGSQTPPLTSKSELSDKKDADQGSPFTCRELSTGCFTSSSRPTCRIYRITSSVLQMRKLRFAEIKFLDWDHTADRKGAGGRQPCRLSGSEATVPSTLLGGAPFASLLEFSQTFQTEISFPLGVDISIFPPWSPG